MCFCSVSFLIFCSGLSPFSSIGSKKSTFPKVETSASLVYSRLGHVKWECGCVAWVWVSMLRCWNLGVASQVAPHLAGRFPGSMGQMEDLLKQWGTLPRGQPVHTDTEAFSSPSSVSLSPCCPALNMFTFNRDLLLSGNNKRAEKQDELMWN